MIDQLLKKYSIADFLAKESAQSLLYFYNYDEKQFVAKDGDSPKLLSHAICVLASVTLSNVRKFNDGERKEQLSGFFKFPKWSFASDDNDAKEFDLYLNAVAICSIGKLISFLGADFNMTGQHRQKLGQHINRLLNDSSGSSYGKFLDQLVLSRQDDAQNHPFFIYWIWKSIRALEKHLAKFILPKNKKAFNNLKNYQGTQLKGLYDYILNRAYYHLSMCSAIADNEEDALKLGYLLLSLDKFTQFANDVVVERGIEMVFSILFKDDKIPKVQAIYRDKTLRIHVSPIELLTLLTETRTVQNNFAKYLKYYSLAFDWLNSTKHEQNKNQQKYFLWMIEPWRGVDKPEAWLNAVVLNFLQGFCNALRSVLRVSLLRKYNASKDKPSTSWNDIDGDFKPSVDELMKTILNDQKKGRKFEKCSLLLYGPPGTAKTTIARAIAWRLNFELLIIAPYYFAENGLDGIIKSARDIFEELMTLQNCVVLFDEVDELVTTRDGEDEKFGKFITTSMLPWFQDLHDKGEIVFIATTNYIKRFDPAIKRPGRFDLVLPIGPPSAGAVASLTKSFLEKKMDQSSFKKNGLSIQKQIIKSMKKVKPPLPEKETIVSPKAKKWFPTIGEIKTICDIIGTQRIADPAVIEAIVNKIGNNPLINIIEMDNFLKDKKTFRYPPDFANE